MINNHDVLFETEIFLKYNTTPDDDKTINE